MAASTFFVSIFGLFVKYTVKFSALTPLMFFRFFVPFIILLPYFYRKRTLYKFLKRRVLLIQLARAVSVLLGQYGLFFYLSKGSLVDATMLWNCSPLYMPILSMMIFGDRFNKITWFSVIVGVIGVICVIKPTGKIFEPFALYGVVAGISVATSQVLYGHSRETEDLDTGLLYFFGISTVLSFLAMLIYNGLIVRDLMDVLHPYFSSNGQIWIYVLILAIAALGNQFLRGMAYKFAKPALLSPIIYLSVVFSGIFDWIFFNNVPDFLFIIGALLIILSSIFRF